MNIILIPAYQEYENLNVLLPMVLIKIAKEDIILLVDALPDFDKWNSLQFSKSNRIIHLPQTGFGLGAALKQGFKYSVELGAKKIITMDSDFSHDPNIIPVLIDKSTQFDLIIGSRYVVGGEFIGGYYRRLISRIGNNLLTLFFSSPVRDMTSNFRCYNSSLIEEILPISSKLSNGYGFLFDVFIFLNGKNATVAEVPIVLAPRRFGNTKLTYLQILKSSYLIVKIKMRKILAR